MGLKVGEWCFPVRVLENEKVKIVPFDPALHSEEFIKNTINEPNIWAHIPRGPFTTAEEFTNFFHNIDFLTPANAILFAVLDNTNPATTPLAGILCYMSTSPTNLSTEIGLVITLPKYRRTHVTTNAVGLLLHYALDAEDAGGLGLRRVVWQANSANLASQRAAERLGFVKEGVFRWNWCLWGGVAAGKIGNGKALPVGRGRGQGDGDLGRDTVVFSCCWDDWEGERDVKGLVDRLMAR